MPTHPERTILSARQGVQWKCHRRLPEKPGAWNESAASSMGGRIVANVGSAPIGVRSADACPYKSEKHA